HIVEEMVHLVSSERLLRRDHDLHGRRGIARVGGDVAAQHVPPHALRELERDARAGRSCRIAAQTSAVLPRFGGEYRREHRERAEKAEELARTDRTALRL